MFLSVTAKERRYMATGVTRYRSVGKGKSGSIIVSMLFTADYWNC